MISVCARDKSSVTVLCYRMMTVSAHISVATRLHARGRYHPSKRRVDGASRKVSLSSGMRAWKTRLVDVEPSRAQLCSLETHQVVARSTHHTKSCRLNGLMSCRNRTKNWLQRTRSRPNESECRPAFTFVLALDSTTSRSYYLTLLPLQCPSRPPQTTQTTQSPWFPASELLRRSKKDDCHCRDEGHNVAIPHRRCPELWSCSDRAHAGECICAYNQ